MLIQYIVPTIPTETWRGYVFIALTNITSDILGIFHPAPQFTTLTKSIFSHLLPCTSAPLLLCSKLHLRI